MRKLLLFLFLILGSIAPSIGQITDESNFSVYYASPGKYTIAEIEISGIR